MLSLSRRIVFRPPVLLSCNLVSSYGFPGFQLALGLSFFRQVVLLLVMVLSRIAMMVFWISRGFFVFAQVLVHHFASQRRRSYHLLCIRPVCGNVFLLCAGL